MAPLGIKRFQNNNNNNKVQLRPFKDILHNLWVLATAWLPVQKSRLKLGRSVLESSSSPLGGSSSRNHGPKIHLSGAAPSASAWAGTHLLFEICRAEATLAWFSWSGVALAIRGTAKLDRPGCRRWEDDSLRWPLLRKWTFGRTHRWDDSRSSLSRPTARFEGYGFVVPTLLRHDLLREHWSCTRTNRNSLSATPTLSCHCPSPAGLPEVLSWRLRSFCLGHILVDALGPFLRWSDGRHSGRNLLLDCGQLQGELPLMPCKWTVRCNVSLPYVRPWCTTGHISLLLRRWMVVMVPFDH